MDPVWLLSVGFVAGAVVTALLFIWWRSDLTNEDEPFTVEDIEAAQEYGGGLILPDDDPKLR